MIEFGKKNYFFVCFKLGDDFADEPKTHTEPTGFSTENTSSWLRDHNMDADISSYARAKLLRKDEYFFRVWYYAKSLFKKKKDDKS